ncbi:MAG: GntR family transcriptional regulator [Candidatus Aminicenantes bacterium]|nr:GntR family transcriptional regulator [Candidatus Aminicenantes bacterium]
MKKFETKSFLLDVDVKSAIPIYEQIKDAIKMAIFSRQLKNNDKIISVRNLSTRHNINPLTILKAYGQLETEGFLYSRRGSGFYVKTSPEKSNKAKNDLLKKEVADFLKKMFSLGFSFKDLKKELKKYPEVSENDQN